MILFHPRSAPTKLSPLKRKVRDRTGKKNRRDLTFPEYVCGYTRMLLTEIDPMTDLYGMINHLAQTAQDAVATPWPAVRIWTTTCLDYIQDGHATWSESALFSDERNRIAWSYARADVLTPVLCPAFNNDTCKLTPPHFVGEMRFIHTCAICYYAAPVSNRVEATTHCAKNCNRRKRPGGRDEWDQAAKQGGRRHCSANQGAAYKKKDNPDAKPKN